MLSHIASRTPSRASRARVGVMARIHTQRDASLGVVNLRHANRFIEKRLPRLNKFVTIVWRNDSLSAKGQELTNILSRWVRSDW